MDTLVNFCDGMKVLGEDENGWQVGGWAVVFDTHDVTSLRDRFTKATDYDIEDGDRRSLYFHHGLDPEIKTAKLGSVTLEVKEAGIWYRGILKKRHDYLKAHAERIADGIKSGAFGTSTGAPAHLVRREKCDGGHEVKMWPLAEVSITPTPAEPLTSCMSLKSLIEAEVEPDNTDEALKTLETGQLTGSKFHEHTTRLHDAVNEYATRFQNWAEGFDSVKAGRAISATNHARLSDLHSALGEFLQMHAPDSGATSDTEDGGEGGEKTGEKDDAMCKSLDLQLLDEQLRYELGRAKRLGVILPTAAAN